MQELLTSPRGKESVQTWGRVCNPRIMAKTHALVPVAASKPITLPAQRSILAGDLCNRHNSRYFRVAVNRGQRRCQNVFSGIDNTLSRLCGPCETASRLLPDAEMQGFSGQPLPTCLTGVQQHVRGSCISAMGHLKRQFRWLLSLIASLPRCPTAPLSMPNTTPSDWQSGTEAIPRPADPLVAGESRGYARKSDTQLCCRDTTVPSHEHITSTKPPPTAAAQTRASANLTK